MKLWMAWLLVVGLLHAAADQDVSKAYLSMKKEAYRYYENAQQQKAIKKVKAFIDQHPESLRAQNLLAVLYYWEGQKSEAKSVLKKLLAQGELPEARRLLSQLQKSSATKKGVRKNKQVAAETKRKKAKKEVKDPKQRFTEDLAYLLNYVKKHPHRIEERKFLLHYFLSINDKKRANAMAKEILAIDPDEAETVALVRRKGLDLTTVKRADTASLRPDARRDKIVALLNEYKEQGAFKRYLNLYRALLERGEYLPKYIHLDALNIAVETKAYHLAKRILVENRFKNSPHLRQLRALLDRKLNVASAL
jgi:hypothetical protein